MGIISLFSSIALINFQVNRKSCVQNAFHSSASKAFVTRKRFSACWGSLHSVPVRAKPRSTGPRAPPIPIERCLRHRAAASPFHSGPRKADVHRTSCARSGCFNGSSCQRKRGCRISKYFLLGGSPALCPNGIEIGHVFDAILYKRSSFPGIPFGMPYFRLFCFQLSKSMPFLMEKDNFPFFRSESCNEAY